MKKTMGFLLLSLLLMAAFVSRAEESTLFPARENEKWGYIQSDGQWAIQPQYDRVTIFSKNGTTHIKD